jgi:hypothetical protein
VKRPEFIYPVTFNSKNQISVLRLMNALEDAFVGAYLGALPLIQNKYILAAAGAILGNECTHRRLIRQSCINLADDRLTGLQVPYDLAFELPISVSAAGSAVCGFIKK